MRIYKFSEFFQFGHEQDLQAWIVKDILIDQHPRLIGQETSIPGLFIGPLYYYLLVPFFAILGMDPRASIIPITLISLATIVSVYFVLTKLYGKKVGFIGAFIYSVSPAIVFLDRWAVPTQPTLLWIIWFYYVVMMFSKGELKVTPILLVLVALIWHIHIAFVPLLLLVPIAILLSKKSFIKVLVSIHRKYLIISLATCFMLLAPFMAFELRHNFQQVRGVLNINQSRAEQARELREGYFKVEVITEYMNRVIWSPFLFQANPKNPMIAKIPVLLFVFMGLTIWLYKKKRLSKQELVIIFSWLVIVFVGQMINKRIISDYYFNNLTIISLTIFSLVAYHLLLNKETAKWVLLGGIIFLVFGIGKVITKKVTLREFDDREAVVEFIAQDASDRGYPCQAINYIGDIPVRYGYRYLFWWKGGRQITPGNDVVVYSIVQPYTISESEIAFKSGEIGVILPADPQVPDESVCNNPERQLLPLNGFVN
ncbi:MAG: ArnT family glycosyltransferase [Candidatus Hodarchaeota archaeon]